MSWKLGLGIKSLIKEDFHKQPILLPCIYHRDFEYHNLLIPPKTLNSPKLIPWYGSTYFGIAVCSINVRTSHLAMPSLCKPMNVANFTFLYKPVGYLQKVDICTLGSQCTFPGLLLKYCSSAIAFLSKVEHK